MSYLDEFCKYITTPVIKTEFNDQVEIFEEFQQTELSVKDDESHSTVHDNLENYTGQSESVLNQGNLENRSDIERSEKADLPKNTVFNNKYISEKHINKNISNEVNSSTHQVNNVRNEKDSLQQHNHMEINKRYDKNIIDKTFDDNSINNEINVTKYTHIKEPKQALKPASIIANPQNKSVKSLNHNNESIIVNNEFPFNRSVININNTSLSEVYKEHVNNYQTSKNSLINNKYIDVPQVKIGQINVLVNDRSLGNAKDKKKSESKLNNNEFGLREL